MQEYTVVQRITRFFWIPRGENRHRPGPIRRLVALWLAMLASGAGLTALGWNDVFGGPYFMAVMLLSHALGDIIEGVRHRWPAALAAVALLSGGSRLTHAVLPDSLDADWATTVAVAVGVTLGLAVSTTITRIPERRLRRPTAGHDSRSDEGHFQ